MKTTKRDCANQSKLPALWPLWFILYVIRIVIPRCLYRRVIVVLHLPHFLSLRLISPPQPSFGQSTFPSLITGLCTVPLKFRLLKELYFLSPKCLFDKKRADPEDQLSFQNPFID